jgi:hypothetical protein
MDSRFLSVSGLAKVQHTMRTLGRSPRPHCSACARPIAAGEDVRLHGAAFHRRCAVYSTNH